MIERVEFEVNIIDNMLEIIPVNGVKNNSIYEISVKGLKPYIKENYVDELSFTLDNSNLDTSLLKDKDYNGAYIDDVKIKFVTAMAPMYCQIIDVESLLEIVDIPSDIILYNIREASKYADYVFEAIFRNSKYNYQNGYKEIKIDPNNVPFAVKQFVRYKATKDCLLKIYMALATNKMLEGTLGEVKFKVREEIPDLKKVLEYLDDEIQKWLDALKGYELEGRAITETAIKGYRHMYYNPKKVPLSMNRGVYRNEY